MGTRTALRPQIGRKSRNPARLRNTTQQSLSFRDSWVKDSRSPWPVGKSWLNKDQAGSGQSKTHLYEYQAVQAIRLCVLEPESIG